MSPKTHAVLAFVILNFLSVASLDSYGIALWAMTQAPVATVAELRETSVLFAALLGACLLKEKFTGRRVAGTLIVVAGVMGLRLGRGE